MSYKSTDLAVIIPTKDRPKQIEQHLQSLAEQHCQVGRIIIIVSGEDIQDTVMQFKDKLPVEYYRSEPGQIRQRNKGISLLNKSTKLVALMDDDVIYHKEAIKEMIDFWNTIEHRSAGVGFNVINLPVIKHNWFRGFLGFSSAKPGQVLTSGFNTSVSNVAENFQVQWLNGGSSVWRQDILQNNPMQEINTRWAVCEDLIFSYPLGKQYPLYVCSDAKVEIEEVIIDRSAKEFYIYRGRAQYLWGLYFVMKNEDISVNSFIINKLIYCIAQMFKGAINFDKNRYFITIGIVRAVFMSLRVLFGFQTVDEFKFEFIDSLN